jgi:hypothetical protein
MVSEYHVQEVRAGFHPVYVNDEDVIEVNAYHGHVFQRGSDYRLLL